MAIVASLWDQICCQKYCSFRWAWFW